MYGTDTHFTYKDFEDALIKGREQVPTQSKGLAISRSPLYGDNKYRACALGAIAIGFGFDWQAEDIDSVYDFLAVRDVPYGIQAIIFQANDREKTGYGDDAALLALKNALA